jgi:hypothetical protein
VLPHKKVSHNPAQGQRIELWSNNLEQQRTRGFPNDIVSLYMDSDSICVASANVNRNIYTFLNYSLEVTQNFGQNLFVTDPFYIFHSDFCNYLQEGFNQSSFTYLINYLEFFDDNAIICKIDSMFFYAYTYNKIFKLNRLSGKLDKSYILTGLRPYFIANNNFIYGIVNDAKRITCK